MTGSPLRQSCILIPVGALWITVISGIPRAEAASFVFSGTTNDGTGSATMEIDVVGNTLTLRLDNTSPTTLNSSAGSNAPGIVAFGFNLAGPLPALVSWALTAYVDAAQTTLLTLGESAEPAGDNWLLGSTIDGVTMDFLPRSNVGGAKGAIYNPEAIGGLAALPNYFSTATLVLSFASPPVLEPLPSGVFMRMQNVGREGGGSLKLFGTPADGPPIINNPEPGSMVLFGIGLVVCSCAYAVRQRRRKGVAAAAHSVPSHEG